MDTRSVLVYILLLSIKSSSILWFSYNKQLWPLGGNLHVWMVNLAQRSQAYSEGLFHLIWFSFLNTAFDDFAKYSYLSKFPQNIMRAVEREQCGHTVRPALSEQKCQQKSQPEGHKVEWESRGVSKTCNDISLKYAMKHVNNDANDRRLVCVGRKQVYPQLYTSHHHRQLQADPRK